MNPIDLLETIDRTDVRMVQRRQQPGFPLAASESLRVSMERPGQHLDRNVTPALAVARPVHLAHATDGQHAEDAMGTELAAQQRWILALNRHATEHL
jgi:hypothetical protein